MLNRSIFILLVGLLIPVSSFGQDIPPVERGVGGVPDASWPGIYFPGFDDIVQSRGLLPLRATEVPEGTLEVRIWVGGGHGYPQLFYRLLETPESVTGEKYLHWPSTSHSDIPGETMHDGMVYSYTGSCDSFEIYETQASCRSIFVTEPDWSDLLEQAKGFGLLTLPDESELPQLEQTIITHGGSSMVVELRGGPSYRTYIYRSPFLDPLWPEAEKAGQIARLLINLRHFVQPADIWGIYRGITSGESRSAFTLCDSDEVWELWFSLEDAAYFSEVTLPDPGPYGYLIEIGGKPSPEWRARRWESEFERILHAVDLLSIAPAMNQDCE